MRVSFGAWPVVVGAVLLLSTSAGPALAKGPSHRVSPYRMWRAAEQARLKEAVAAGGDRKNVVALRARVRRFGKARVRKAGLDLAALAKARRPETVLRKATGRLQDAAREEYGQQARAMVRRFGAELPAIAVPAAVRRGSDWGRRLAAFHTFLESSIAERHKRIATYKRSQSNWVGDTFGRRIEETQAEIQVLERYRAPLDGLRALLDAVSAWEQQTGRRRPARGAGEAERQALKKRLVARPGVLAVRAQVPGYLAVEVDAEHAAGIARAIERARSGASALEKGEVLVREGFPELPSLLGLESWASAGLGWHALRVEHQNKVVAVWVCARVPDRRTTVVETDGGRLVRLEETRLERSGS